MIKLTGINKIYRTNEIETLALENVNLDVAKGEFVSIMVCMISNKLVARSIVITLGKSQKMTLSSILRETRLSFFVSKNMV